MEARINSGEKYKTQICIMFTVYILRTSSNSLYTGQTNNLSKRLLEHKNKTHRSAKYLRRFAFFELVYTEKIATRSLALKREAEIKKMPKAKKEALVNSKSLSS